MGLSSPAYPPNPNVEDGVFYPEADGLPMADSTLQWDWMERLKGGLDARTPHFVASNLFWYPVKGQPKIVVAPDVFVAPGRPKGFRRSYRQWNEDNTPPMLAVEILSENNSVREMVEKQAFYDRHGAEEYVVIDPERHRVDVWVRRDGHLVAVKVVERWVSATGLRFAWEDGELVAFGPDGAPMRTVAEEHARAEAEKYRAEAEKSRAEAEKSRAEAEKSRAEAEKSRAMAMAAKLRSLGIDPDSL
jgi:hypothetical protein